MKKIYDKTLAQLCLDSSNKYKNLPALTMLSDGKISRSITYSVFGKRAQQIGALLKKTGLVKGGKVMLLSDNCPEWAVFYFGISFAGAVSVPLLTGFSAEQIEHIAIHSGISAVCLGQNAAEKIEQAENRSFFEKLPLIYIDSINSEEETAEITVSINGEKKLMRLDQTVDSNFISEQNPEELATIIYTSGTSGSSKGVMLSGRNIISCAYSCIKFVNLTTRDRLLSVLPLAHSYECTIGLLIPLIAGSSITYIDKPPSQSVLLPAVKAVRPTIMLTVPLLIEKIYFNVVAPKLKNNQLYKFPFTRSLAIRFAGKKVMKAFGGCIRFFGIGGAPLSAEVESFLHRARFPYAIGYGLTECAPLIAGNAPLHSTVGSAGTAPEGVSLRIGKCDVQCGANEGEIQVYGPNNMIGYYNDEKRTKEAFTEDGWLRTGDLGFIDKKKRVFVRGRLKALILGPSGENIYPEEIEGLLGSSQLVEDALVYSGKRGELVAIVCLTDAAKTAAVAIEQTLEELRAWVNKKLADFSRLSRIEIRYEPFEKTPTMKIKRYLYVPGTALVV